MMHMQSLSQEQIGDDYQAKVFSQDYSAKAKIADVQIIELRRFVDDGGSFAELARFSDAGTMEGLPDFQVQQTSFSQILPGSIKAFHLHYNQEDVWFVPPTDRLLVGLIDTRKDSSSYGVSQRFVMGDGRSQLLYIPRGVAHGAGNLWQQPANLFYFVNQKFDLQKPDEQRLPWDVLGADFWQLTQG